MNHDFFNAKIRTYIINYLKNSKDVFSNQSIIELFNDFLRPHEQQFIFDKLNSLEKNPVELSSLINVPVNVPVVDDPEIEKLAAEMGFDKVSQSTINNILGPQKRNIKKYKRLIEDKLGNDYKLESDLLCDLNEFLLQQEIINHPVPHELTELKRAFNLSDSELEILTLLISMSFSNIFEGFVESHFGRRNSDLRVMKKVFSDFLDISEHKISKDLSRNSVLIKSSLIEISKYEFSISDDTHTYVLEGGENSLISKYVKLVQLDDLLPISEFPLSSSKIETLISILKTDKPCNILLYGPPGVGKTELSRTLASLVGKELYSINISDKDGDESREARKRSLVAAQHHPALADSLILVDESDSIINSKINFDLNYFGNIGSDTKAWINGYFDENKRQMIWITNTFFKIDDSLVRRFDFTLGFNELNSLQKEKVLSSLLSKSNSHYLTDEDIKSLSISSRVSSGHFSSALKVVSELDVEETTKKEHLFNILDEYQNILSGRPLNLKKINQSYTLEGLNIDQDPHKVIDFSRTILERMEQNKSLDLNLNILLYGPPGAGKTEFAKYLSFTLGKELAIKRTSDLISKYVGDSEKLIHKAFLEAQRSNKILLIDEADSLFSKRENAQHSWEVTRVNELLTCMENFKGILICATNFVDNIDMAAQRRFLFRLKFNYLNQDGAKKFYKTFFNEFNLSDLSQEEITKLTSIKGLTPSDFNTLKSKFLIIPPKDNEEIIELLEGEVGYKASLFKSKIGL